MKYILTTSILMFLQFFLDSCTHINGQNEKINPVSHNSKQQNSPEDLAKRCVCAQIWLPVCGEDNKTYSNSCSAECAGVKYKAGSCAITE